MLLKRHRFSLEIIVYLCSFACDIGCYVVNNFHYYQLDNAEIANTRRKRDFNQQHNYANNNVPLPLNFQQNNENNAYTSPSISNQNTPYVPDYVNYGRINNGYPNTFNNYGHDAVGPDQYSSSNPNYPEGLGNEDFQGQPGPPQSNSGPFAGQGNNPMIMPQGPREQKINEPNGGGLPGQGNFNPMRTPQSIEQKINDPNMDGLPANMYQEHNTAFYPNQPNQVNEFSGTGQSVTQLNNPNKHSGFEATAANASSADPLLLFEQRMHAVEKLKKLYELKKFLSTDSANVSYTFVGNNKTIGARESVSLDQIKKEFGVLENKHMNQNAKGLQINRNNNNPMVPGSFAYSVGNADPNLAFPPQAQPPLPYYPAFQQEEFQNQNQYYQNPTQNQYYYHQLQNSPQTLNSNSYQQPYPMQQFNPYQQNQDMYSQIQPQGFGPQYVSNQQYEGLNSQILRQNSFSSQYGPKLPFPRNLETQNQYPVLPNAVAQDTNIPPPQPEKTWRLQDGKQTMEQLKMGYFTAFLHQLFVILSHKLPDDTRDLIQSSTFIFDKLLESGKLSEMGKPATTAFQNGLLVLSGYTSERLKSQAQAAALMMKNRQLVLPADVNSIFTLVDDGGYNAEEGNQLLKTLEGVDAYSRNGGVNAMEVAGSVLSSVLRPYWKAPEANKANLFKLINTGLQKRFKFDARRFEKQNETDKKTYSAKINKQNKHGRLQRNKSTYGNSLRNKNRSNEDLITRKKERKSSEKKANEVKYNVTHRTAKVIRETQAFGTESTTNQTDQANFENEDDSYDKEIRNIKVETVEINGQEPKIDAKNILKEKHEYSEPIAGRRKGDDKTDIRNNTVKKQIGISNVKSNTHKLMTESTSNDEDKKLKAMLVNVIKKSSIVFKRRTDGIAKGKEKNDDVSISDDEEENNNTNPEVTPARPKAEHFVYDDIPGWYEQILPPLVVVTKHPGSLDIANTTSDPIESLSTRSWNLQNAYQTMIRHRMGYLTSYLFQLLLIISDKSPGDTLPIIRGVKDVVGRMLKSGKLYEMGEPSLQMLRTGVEAMANWSSEEVQSQAKLGTFMIANNEIFLTDYLDIIKVIDSAYDIDHADQLFETLEEVNAYKRTEDKDAETIAEHIIKAILSPYWKTFYKSGRDRLFQSINEKLLQYFQSNKTLFKEIDNKTEQATSYTKDRSMEEFRDIFGTTKNASAVIQKDTSKDEVTNSFKDDVAKRVASEDKKVTNRFKARRLQHRLERDVRLERKDFEYRERNKQKVYHKPGQNHRLEVIRTRVVGR